MTPPTEIVATWLPLWMALADAALEAAQASGAEPVGLLALADRAAGDHKGRYAWPSVFGRRRDEYVGAALIWSAKAFCRQDTAEMRATLADALLEMALAFKARLTRVAARQDDEPPGPAMIIPLRRRRDIDDVDDGGEG